MPENHGPIKKAHNANTVVCIKMTTSELTGLIYKMNMRTILTFLIISTSYQVSYTQKNGISNDSIMMEKAMKIADSLLLLEHPNDSNTLYKEHQAIWEYERQEAITGVYGKEKKGKSVKLIDSLTNNYYILDSTHIYIAAFNKSGKAIWKTDPYKDNSIREYRTKRPVIIHYGFGVSPNYFPDRIKEGSKVIWITYSNSQFGFIDLNTGKYYWCGQD